MVFMGRAASRIWHLSLQADKTHIIQPLFIANIKTLLYHFARLRSYNAHHETCNPFTNTWAERASLH